MKELAAPLTVNTMPEGTLKAFADHGELDPPVTRDGGDCEAVLGRFAAAGIDLDALAARLQDEGASSFVASWNELMGVLSSKCEALGKAASPVMAMVTTPEHEALAPRLINRDRFPPPSRRPELTSGRRADLF